MYPTNAYKLEKYKAKYSNAISSSDKARYSTKIRHYSKQLVQAGGLAESKCKIDPTDIVLAGHGGSDTIILITTDHKVYKVFPLYYTKKTIDTKIERRTKKHTKMFDMEIRIHRDLTKSIVDPNISPHFVRWVTDYMCSNIKELFEECPKTYMEFVKLEKTQRIEKICSKLYKASEVGAITSFHVLQMEHCNYTCSDFIKDLSKMQIHDMITLLDIFFFQIIYTVIKTQELYPYFTHGDLFMRNIMGIREKDNCNYYTYTYGSNTFYVPQKLFFPKISDFGEASLTENDYKIYNEKPVKTHTKDVYNLIYDVYDGGGLGGDSLMSLCKDDETKKAIRSYFSTFFDTDVIDQMKTVSKKNMEWDWSVLEDKDIQKEIKLANPIDLMNTYFTKIFSSIHSNVGSFGK